MSNSERKLDAMLTAALERRPEVAVPAGFTARVMTSLPARRPVRATTHYGRLAAYICMVLLVAAMLWIGRSGPAFSLSLGNMSFVLEMLCTLALLLLILFTEMAEGLLT